ncbi:transposase family protein [Streptomyces sp. NPDC056910]|uniref:transposase family protein n=1 Tax=Streptomyces sp. NPDC056910 TaxID=3345964 RepID=UPI00368D9378
MTHVILDGALVESDRVCGKRENGNDLWFSQKHKAFGGNVQFLSAPDGTPLWVSEVEPGSTPDITAARIHVLPALYKAAAQGLPTLADKGYIGAGIGIRVPVHRPKGRSEQARAPFGCRVAPSLLQDLPYRGCGHPHSRPLSCREYASCSPRESPIPIG